MKRVLCLIFLLALGGAALGQQRADLQLSLERANPAYAAGTGPRVAIDQAHNNFHTAGGRYAPFAALLEAEGYRVSANTRRFSDDWRPDFDILVIVNALHPDSVNQWSKPAPSAFTPGEVERLLDWVEGGGALLLIADHMPFPAAAAELARSLGFHFYNGYALREATGENRGIITFSRADGSLAPHPIVTGAGSRPAVPFVTTFTGQAFLAPAQARPLLQLGRQHALYLPRKAGQITALTTHIPVESWLQGATLEIGSGRVAVFGEAAAFTAQVTGDGRKIGMNHPRAVHNPDFILNTLHWLRPTAER